MLNDVEAEALATNEVETTVLNDVEAEALATAEVDAEVDADALATADVEALACKLAAFSLAVMLATCALVDNEADTISEVEALVLTTVDKL